MSHNHLTYAICARSAVDVLTVEQGVALFDAVHGTYSTTRQSLDGVDMVLKWTTADGVPPNIPAHTTYTHAGILAEMADPHWTAAE